MARWHDLATWRGPSPNISEGKQTEVRGLVVHIAEGWYEGTISWQKNPSADVSSHFIVSRAGKIAQMVDTADAAWTQRSGNGEWLSVECEGFTKGNKRNPGGWESLSDAQIDAIARLLLRCHTSYSVPLQATSSATGRGLGHHSLGGESWGHLDCPGPPIIAQKPAIVQRALALKNGDDEMQLTDKITLIKDKAVPYSDKEWSVGFTLASTNYYAVKVHNALMVELAAAKKRDEAILAKLAGADTKSILEAVNKRAAEDASRDAVLMAEASAAVNAALPSVQEIAAAVAAAVDHDLDTAAVEDALRRVLGGVDDAGE
jgi:hypothetical protein